MDSELQAELHRIRDSISEVHHRVNEDQGALAEHLKECAEQHAATNQLIHNLKERLKTLEKMSKWQLIILGVLIAAAILGMEPVLQAIFARLEIGV